MWYCSYHDMHTQDIDSNLELLPLSSHAYILKAYSKTRLWDIYAPGCQSSTVAINIIQQAEHHFSGAERFA